MSAGTAVARGAAALFGSIVRLRNRYYDRPGVSVSAPVPVISVGNLTVGGTGKTPLVAMLARDILADGRRPAVVSRGYGGSAGRGPLVVAPARGPVVGPELCGDEPFLLARRLAEAVVVVGSDRVRGAREAARLGAEVVLLDDGFQHRRIRRDLDIVVLDRDDPFGGSALLPAGRLREPVASLARADVVVVSRSPPGSPIDDIATVVRAHAGDIPVVRCEHRAVAFVTRTGHRRPAPTRAVAFCAIGRPEAFRRALLACGVELVHFASFRDHHPFRALDLDPLVRLAGEQEAALVTTEKDLARLERPDAPDPGDVVALRVEAVVDQPETILGRIRSLTGKR